MQKNNKTKAGEALRKDIQKILDSTHDAMIVVDPEGIITIFNKSAEKLTGVASEFALGKKVDSVIDNTRLLIVLETGLAELNQQQPLNKTTIITSRMPVFDDDGMIIGALAVFRDISEVIELAERITDLNRIRETLEATFNATQDAISVVDAEGKGLLINPAYTRMTGYTEKDIIGVDCTYDLAEGESVHMEVLKTGKPVKGKKLKVGLNRKDVVAEAAPIFDKGVLKGSVAIIHDLTEINQIYKQLDQAKQIIRNLEAKYTFDDIIGKSEILINAIEKAKIAAETPATVIIRGESGTGKELFAHAIHNASNRKFAQFVRVNCAAISENLLESELFGYEEGAFTGASKGGKIGLFEKANGGTIFLDEIGELSLSTQAKLLRVLQEKEIIRVGGNKPISIDVRIISATNVDLERAIENRLFRQDLYYRLNVVPINIPALREHKIDIPALVNHLISKYNQEYGRNVSGVSQRALDMIIKYNWPGNVRELENFIGRAMINIKINEYLIDTKHLPSILPLSINVDENVHADTDTFESLDLAECTRMFEKTHIEQVLKLNDGNREESARQLGVSLRTLYYKIKNLNI